MRAPLSLALTAGPHSPSTQHPPAPQEEPAQAPLPPVQPCPGQGLVVALLVLKAFLRHHERHLVQVGGVILGVSVKEEGLRVGMEPPSP